MYHYCLAYKYHSIKMYWPHELMTWAFICLSGKWDSTLESHRSIYTSFLKINYLFIFREGWRRKKKGRETLMWERNINQLLPVCISIGEEPATQACDLTRNWTCDLSFCGMMPNQLSHTSQGNLYPVLRFNDYLDCLV